MYVRPISTRLVRGRSTPAIRAIHLNLSSQLSVLSLQPSSLSLFVLLIRTDDPHHAAAADDLALVADSLHRCSNFHHDLTPSRRIPGNVPRAQRILSTIRPRPRSSGDSSTRTRSPTSKRMKLRSSRSAI